MESLPYIPLFIRMDYYQDDIKQGRYASRAGLLALADPKVTPAITVRPQVRYKITEIAQRLEKETVQKMQSALHVWKQQGGYTNGKSPDFLFSAGSPANDLMLLKSQAEREAYNLLNGEEQAQWDQHNQPRLSKLSSLQALE